MKKLLTGLIYQIMGLTLNKSVLHRIWYAERVFFGMSGKSVFEVAKLHTTGHASACVEPAIGGLRTKDLITQRPVPKARQTKQVQLTAIKSKSKKEGRK